MDSDSLFYKKIEDNNGDICTNCYRRLRYKYEPAEEYPDKQFPDFVSDRLEYDPQVDFGYVDDKENTGRPSVKKSYCTCGVIDQGTKFRPLNSEEMMEIAHRINERLFEEGVEHDGDVFLEKVDSLKSDPDMQFNEEKIFEKATRQSVREDRDTENRNKVTA